MKQICLILFFLIAGFNVSAQPDSTIIIQDTASAMEAPADLQKLIGEIEAKAKKQVSADADIEIDGLIFDETKTKSGRDFYDYFYNHWQAPPDARNYSIYITEKPYRLMITQIEVKINENAVFQSFLQPRGDIIEQLAEQAVARTQLYLANYEELMRQLEGDDRSGTGIF
jgi:curli production assembly/transport component CsgE